MELNRVAFHYPDGTSAAYEFHPRITVVDVHPAHRRALAEHLVGPVRAALRGERRGQPALLALLAESLLSNRPSRRRGPAGLPAGSVAAG